MGAIALSVVHMVLDRDNMPGRGQRVAVVPRKQRTVALRQSARTGGNKWGSLVRGRRVALVGKSDQRGRVEIASMHDCEKPRAARQGAERHHSVGPKLPRHRDEKWLNAVPFGRTATCLQGRVLVGNCRVKRGVTNAMPAFEIKAAASDTVGSDPALPKGTR